MKISIIIPTYNESENIQSITEEIFKYLPETDIIVVDDDSKDGTGKIAEQLSKKNAKVKLISRKDKKRSFSQSYIDGFKSAIADGADYIIQMDADFSHNPEYLPILVEKLKDYDLVIGSRYIDNGKTKNWSLYRQFISVGGNLYSKLITGIPLSDSTSGFVAWRAPLLKKMDLDKIYSDGYGFQVEMKFKAWKDGIKMCEIPIIFVDRKFGSSKMKRRIVLEAAITCLKLRFLNN